MIATTLSAIVIDGESSDRTSFLDALSDRGFRCETASSPNEADPHFAKTYFDAVVVYERVVEDGLCDFVSTIPISCWFGHMPSIAPHCKPPTLPRVPKAMTPHCKLVYT
jgi:hypothetical protein